MGPAWQNPIQRTVRTAHLSVLMTVHSFRTVLINQPCYRQTNITAQMSIAWHDIESYWKVVVVFQERYRHRGSSEPASVNIIDLTWRLDLTPWLGLTPSLSPITHGSSSSSSSPSSRSPLAYSLTRSVFHSELKTWLFGKSFPPWTFSFPTGLIPRTLGSFNVFICSTAGLVCMVC